MAKFSENRHISDLINMSCNTDIPNIFSPTVVNSKREKCHQVTVERD